MIKLLENFRLIISIPISIFIGLIVVGCFLFLTIYQEIYYSASRHAVQDMKNELAHSEKALRLIRKQGTITDLNEYIADHGTFFGHVLAVLVSPNKKVVASTSVEWVDKRLDEIPALLKYKDYVQLGFQKDSFQVQYSLHDRQIWGVASICNSETECDSFLLVRRAIYWENELKEYFYSIVSKFSTALVVVVFLVLTLFHFMVARRVQIILNSIWLFKNKQIYSEVNLSGRDELAVIFRHMQELFSDLEKSQKELKEKLVISTDRADSNDKLVKLAITRSGTGYFIFDISSGKLICDEKAIEIFGIDKEISNVKYEDYLQAIHPEDTEKAVSDLNAYLQEKEIIHFDIHFKVNSPKTRELVYVYVNSSVDRDDLGQPMRLYGLVIDETKVVLEANKLTNEKNIAERENEIKSKFLAMMSHEIRTPMNSIIGMSELTLKTSLNDVQRKYIETVRSTSKSLLSILNDILDFSKIEAGKFTVKMAPFSLEKLIDDVFQIAKILVSNRQIQINFEVDENVPKFIISDANRIKQVLINLISNAIKFTSQGEVVLHVAKVEENLLTDSHKKINLSFTVRDTGRGISDENLKLLFNPFTQIDDGLNRRYEGTGLGLSISKSLVKLLGGEITATSQLNVGSQFQFNVPVELSHEKALNQWEDTNQLKTVFDKKLLKNLRVLIVEDNKINQDLVCEVLKAVDCIVEVVNDGYAALDILKKDAKFDCILMDIQMPMLDGYRTTEHIRQSHSKDQLPVIAMSANVLGSDIEKAYQSGMNDYIPKPFDPEQLYFKILQASVLKNDLSSLSESYLTSLQVREQNNLPAADQAKVLALQSVGISYEETCKKFGGKTEFYDNLLNKFIETQVPTIYALQELIEKGEFAELKKRLHAIKGVSANLGLKPLAVFIQKMESACQDQDPILATQYKHLLEQIEKIKSQISKHVKLA